MKIVGIVGWKDSGKTTIATKIINKLSSKILVLLQLNMHITNLI